jgi:VCBS repeat protein
VFLHRSVSVGHLNRRLHPDATAKQFVHDNTPRRMQMRTVPHRVLPSFAGLIGAASSLIAQSLPASTNPSKYEFAALNGRRSWRRTAAAIVLALWPAFAGASDRYILGDTIHSITPFDGNVTNKSYPLDYTGDGKTDLLILDAGGTLARYKSDGTSLITDGSQTIAGYAPALRQLLPMDLNGDGKMDFIVLSTGGVMQKYVSNGGSFTEGTSQVFLPYSPGDREVIPMDVDGNAKTDLVVHYDSGQLEIYRSDGTGFPYQASQTVSAYQPSTRRMYSTDFSGDGKTDFVILHDGGTLERYQSDGSLFTGLSGAMVMNGYIPGARELLPVEISGDGRRDLILYHSGGRIEPYVSNGQSFTDENGAKHDQVLGGYDPASQELFAADINGDHRTELCIRATTGSLRTYWLKTLPIWGDDLLVQQAPSLQPANVGEAYVGGLVADPALLVVGDSLITFFEAAKQGTPGEVWMASTNAAAYPNWGTPTLVSSAGLHHFSHPVALINNGFVYVVYNTNEGTGTLYMRSAPVSAFPSPSESDWSRAPDGSKDTVLFDTNILQPAWIHMVEFTIFEHGTGWYLLAIDSEIINNVEVGDHVVKRVFLVGLFVELERRNTPEAQQR